MQKTLKTKYNSEAYNKCNPEEQWIRITDGCPNQCEFCYAPRVLQYHGVPKIIRNKVKIMDMNPLAVSYQSIMDNGNSIKSFRLDDLPTKLNGRVIHYEMICGFDYRYITYSIADDLYSLRFGRFNRKGKWQRGVRIAWDFEHSLKNDILRHTKVCGFQR